MDLDSFASLEDNIKVPTQYSETEMRMELSLTGLANYRGIKNFEEF